MKEKMSRTELKKVFGLAVDGGCSDAYRIIVNALAYMPKERQVIDIDDLLTVLNSLSRKWQKEIDIACGA